MTGWTRSEPLRDAVARGRLPLLTSLASAAAFLVLSVLVATHVTQRVDTRAVEWLRPHGEWGRSQVLLMPVIDGLAPPRVFLLLVVVGVSASIWRASWRPGAWAALLALAGVTLTMVAKFAVHRPDPQYEMSAIGGSYPSGHVVALLLCLGGSVLVLRSPTRWWYWLPVGLLGAAMGAALLVTAAHSVTDVAGGALLAVALLAAASVTPLRQTAAGVRGGARDRRGRRRPSPHGAPADDPLR